MNPCDSNNPQHESDDLPLRLAPDQDDETALPFTHKKPEPCDPAQAANQETVLEKTTPPAGEDADPLKQALQWALDSLHQPAMAAADWLARDIDPSHPSAAALLSDPKITLAQVRQAKAVFKTMRIVGEKSADRRVGARMYAAAIAAGLVRHGRKITTQSDAALKRGFQGLLDDRRMPLPLRDLSGMALCILDEKKFATPDQNQTRSKSA